MDIPVHVGPPAGRIARAHVVAGSMLMSCESCGEPIWIDPLSCREIAEVVHAHMCERCVADRLHPGDVFVITLGALRRIDAHMRRN